MAIEKTYFQTDTYENNLTALKNWLDQNATEYFDSITFDTYDGIRCYNGTSYVRIRNVYSTPVFEINNGTTYQTCGRDYVYFYWAAKTSKGICIWADSRDHVFISKTKSGKTFAYIMGYSNNADPYKDIVYAETTDTQIHKIGGFSGDGNALRHWYSAHRSESPIGKTSFAPLISYNGEVADGIYMTPQSELEGVSGTIIDENDVKYIYDGYVALIE